MSLSWSFPAAANLVLVATLYGLVTEPVDITPIAPPARTPPSSQVASYGDAPTTLGLSAIERNHVHARPLFAPDRRRWEPPEPPVPVAIAAPPRTAPLPQPEPLPEFVLLGVAISKGRARALITEEDGSEGEAAWLAEGDSLRNWTVRAITSTTVTLSHERREVALDLRAAASGG